MSEQQWLEATDPSILFDFVRKQASERKLRLFACACVRRIWSQLPDDRCRRAIEVGELFADKKLGYKKRREAHLALDPVINRTWKRGGFSPENFAACAALACLMTDSLSTYNHVQWSLPENEREREMAVQADICRDLFGNPFRPMNVEDAWLTWNHGAIPKAASAAYEDRMMPSGHLDNGRLAVLADMLEEAGCTDAQVLEHLRRPGAVHVRGCFALDLLLGKQ